MINNNITPLKCQVVIEIKEK